jgi:hypothetical protein
MTASPRLQIPFDELVRQLVVSAFVIGAAALALGKPIREVEQAITTAGNGEKATLQERLRELKTRQQAHEQTAKAAQAEGDALYWPIYNLDLKNPHAKAGLEHAALVNEVEA